MMGLTFSAALLAYATSTAPMIDSVTTGTVHGLVTDSAGHPLTHAEVVITSGAFAKPMRYWTDTEGEYLIETLPAGDNYRVMVTAPGFQTRVSEAFAVDPNERYLVNFHMLRATAESHKGTMIVLSANTAQTAFDVLRTNPELLARGLAHGCPAVRSVYINGQRRDIASDEPTSAVHTITDGDASTVMLSPAAAEALRGVPAAALREIRYLDCTQRPPAGVRRNVLLVATR